MEKVQTASVSCAYPYTFNGLDARINLELDKLYKTYDSRLTIRDIKLTSTAVDNGRAGEKHNALIIYTVSD